MSEPVVLMVEWDDASNIAVWTDLAEIADWAKSPTHHVRSVGYLVYEDDDCVVLAARVAWHAEPAQVGLFERIPKAMVTGREILTPRG